MNYYAARQRKDGRWDYTCRNDDFIHPVGYCSKYRPLTDGSLKGMYPDDYLEQKEKERVVFKDNYHEDGHATKEEACECYTRHLFDTTLRLDGNLEDTQRKCKICSEWTTGYAQVNNGSMYDLCDQHRTREIVETLFGTVGEIWSS